MRRIRWHRELVQHSYFDSPRWEYSLHIGRLTVTWR